MAKISTYSNDSNITGSDILLGSSIETTQNGENVYATRNYPLSELAAFFQTYDADLDSSITSLTSRVTDLEGQSYLTEHPNITAASSVNNTGQNFIQDITLDSNGHVVGIVSAEATGSAGGITTETDPTVASHIKAITSTQISNWDTAYGWGDHSTQNYVTLTDVADAGYLTSFSETDPIFIASQAFDITSSNKSNWTTSYNESITAISVVASVVNGVNKKTVNLSRRNGTTISATFTDISETGSGGVTDTNDFVTGAAFSESSNIPVLTLSIPNQTNVVSTGLEDIIYTQSEIDDFNYLQANDLTVTTASATEAADGSLVYTPNTGNGTGVFAFTKPDIDGKIDARVDKTFVDALSIDADTLDGEDGDYYLNFENFYGNYKTDYDDNGNRRVFGILYYIGSATTLTNVQSQAPAGTFDFTTNKLTLTANDSNWSEFAPTSASSGAQNVFIVTWDSTNTGAGTETARTVSFDTAISSTQFIGPVTFTELSTPNSTVIDGSNITTGSIESTNYSAGSDGFSTAGSKINLTDGSISSKEFRVNSDGSAKFLGGLAVEEGVFTVNSTTGLISIGSVEINQQRISIVSTSSANIGEINFVQRIGNSDTEIASIQNFSGSNITNPEFRIQTTQNGGPLRIYGYDTNSNSGDFYESVRMSSDRDLSIQADSVLVGGTLTYHVTATLANSGASEAKELCRLSTYSGAGSRSLIIEVLGSCDTHAVQAVFGARSTSSGAWQLTRRIHQGDTGNFSISEITGNAIEMRNLTSSSSLPANAVIRISGSREIMNYDDLEQILNFNNFSRDTYAVATT